jgi:hypothetical protein
MEEPVGQGVGLEPGHRVRRVVDGGREHVVPLQDLVEDDAVHEPAEAHSQQHARDERTA